MKAVVIGAGMGGLSAAAFLAKRGIHTTVLEKNSHVGGRVREWKEKGYRFDMGPSWYFMPEQYDRWFESFGANRRSLYEIRRVDPCCKIFFQDDVLEVPAEKHKLIELFDSIEPGSGGRLQSLLYEAARTYRYFMPHAVMKNTHGLFNKMRLALSSLRHLGLHALFKTYHRRVKEVAIDHRLRKILEYPCVFLGSMPRGIPSVYPMLSHVDPSLDTWYPVGGFSRVSDAMAKVSRSLGVSIVTNAEVQSFEWKNDKSIAAVCTADKTFDADVIVANADRHFVDQLLLHEKKRDFSAKQWNKLPISHGVLSMYWGVRNSLSHFASHTFFFDTSWDQHLSSLRKQTWPFQPLFYAHCPSKVDPTAAPSGSTALSVLVPVPVGISDSKNERAALIARVLSRLEPYVDVGTFPAAIECERIMGLRDFQRDYNAFQGNAFGMSMTLGQSAIFRLENKARRVKNLYYCGHYTIPGTGMTMSMISGELAAERIAREWRIT